VRTFILTYVGLKADRWSWKSGAASITKEFLKQNARDNPPVDCLLRWRSALKYGGSFIDPLERNICPDGRVHPEWKVGGARTWRLSCSNPNLTNPPSVPELKRIIVASPGCAIVALDYSQIELRVLASLANEVPMIEGFKRGEDPHRATTRRLLERDDVTDKEREIGKRLNFGTVYGIEAHGLRTKFGIPTATGEAMLKRFWESHPAITRWMQEQKDRLLEHQCSVSPYGKVRHLPIIGGEQELARLIRQASNFPVQSAAAEITLDAMLLMEAALKKMRAWFVAQIYDAVYIECPLSQVGEVSAYAQETMEGMAARIAWLRTPLAVDVKTGPSLGELEKSHAA